VIDIILQHNQPYQSTVPDSLFILESDAFYNLEVALFNADKIFGQILDFRTEKPLDSVRISIRKNVFTYTDQFGDFILKIPENLQQQKWHRVTHVKEREIV